MNNKSKHGYGFIIINYKYIDHEVPSVVFGNGSVRVTTIYNPEECVTGISLCEAPLLRPIGEIYIEDGVPKDPTEDSLFIQKNAKYQFLFDNAESIDVVINRFNEAKEKLLDQQSKELKS